MSELADLWHDQEQYTPREVVARKAEIERLQGLVHELRAFIKDCGLEADFEAWQEDHRGS